MDWLTQTDLNILNWIQETMQCTFLDTVMPIVTWLGEYGIVCIALALVLLLIPKTRRTGLGIGIALLLGVLIGNVVLKNLIDRLRPFEVQEGVHLLVKALYDGSFPSGHSLACFETATVLMIRNRKAGTVALALATLVAFSRMYLFMHFPTDVLGGVAIGVVFGILGWWLAGKVLDFTEPRISEWWQKRSKQQ